MRGVAELLSESRIIDLGPLPAPRLGSDARVQQAVQTLSKARRGAVVAVRDEIPVGILTERDVVNRLAGETEHRMRAFEDVMTKPPVTLSRRAALTEAIQLMNDRRHRHLVLVDREGRLKGLLNTNDIVQFITDQFPEDTVNLPPRLHQQYAREEGG